jgi:hypothetical protein
MRRDSHRHASSSSQEEDVAAVGALLVQLYSRRLHHVSCGDLPYWQRQIRRLPPSARAFARACLDSDPARRPQVAALLQDDFFPPAVRAAAVLLAQLGWPEATGAGGAPDAATHLRSANAEAVLARLALSGVIDQLQRAAGALTLCLPTLLHLLETASVAPASLPQQTLKPFAAEGFAAVLRQLLRALSRQQAQAQLLPLLRRVLSGKQHTGGRAAAAHAHATEAAVLAAVLQPDLLWALIEAAGLSAYLDALHGEVLELVCGRAQPAQLPSAADSADLAMQVSLLSFPLSSSAASC